MYEELFITLHLYAALQSVSSDLLRGHWLLVLYRTRCCSSYLANTLVELYTLCIYKLILFE